MSVFKKYQINQLEIIKKNDIKSWFTAPKPNQIFKLSSLKYLNLDAEFYMISLKIKKYYKDEIPIKNLNQNIESLIIF